MLKHRVFVGNTVGATIRIHLIVTETVRQQIGQVQIIGMQNMAAIQQDARRKLFIHALGHVRGNP